MIVKISGKLVQKKEQSVILKNDNISYEVLVPESVLSRIEDTIDEEGSITLITYHYFQIGQSSGVPMLVGFINEIEKDFFLQFIKVSGIGPRAAVRALNKSISEITKAIDSGDLKFLNTLPGIGTQRAKEIIAKLQGKIGKFGLIQDKALARKEIKGKPDWHDEALNILMQLQYKKQEAKDMITKALEESKDINSAEELLNEIYKQKVSS